MIHHFPFLLYNEEMQFKVEILPFDKKIGSFISAHHYSIRVSDSKKGTPK